MQNMMDNFLFSYFSLYFEKSDINMAIMAKASRNMNINEYCGIFDMQKSSIAIATIKNIISVLFIKSPF